ncbi:hypothetical protein B9Z55_015859 [Caenorhabditis nigoni]|uniref:Uncharacterized protein n=1 Tax=Caenorhabditis nigoni TaxID=1611254 RepID=A0A2G5UCF3_9PELO|nr:hypothetical protein B9Z55_015859 [Caenorhabditis nigoni]
MTWHGASRDATRPKAVRMQFECTLLQPRAHTIMDILSEADYAVTTVETFDEFENFDDDVKDTDWDPEDDEARVQLYATVPA